MWYRIRRWFRNLFRPKPTPAPRVKPQPSGRQWERNVPRQERLIRLFNTMEREYIGPQIAGHITWYLDKCLEGKESYLKAQELTGVPWEVVACTHGLEASFNFEKNLMNGQPLGQVTTWVPRGYGPWDTWEESAVDAFKLKDEEGKLPKEWDLGNTLDFLLRYNGTGYEKYHNLNSPYLWSYTNHYANQGGGKYVSDGKFDRNAISLQVGAALMLKELNYGG